MAKIVKAYPGTRISPQNLSFNSWNKVIFQFRIFPRKPWDWESCHETFRKVKKSWDSQQNCESWQVCLIWHFLPKPVCSRKKFCIKWALQHSLRCPLKLYKFHCTCLTPFALTIDVERYEIASCVTDVHV